MSADKPKSVAESRELGERAPAAGPATVALSGVEKEDRKRTAGAVAEMIRTRYAGEAHVTLAEVRDAAGFSASRSCDVMSMGTWPSRGLTLRGFEIKVSRSDWVRECADPSKAETFATYCDEWYVAAGDSKIVQLDELPATWGLLVAKGSRLECVKPAVKNISPTPIDRSFLAALLRRAIDQGPTAKLIEAAKAQSYEHGKRDADSKARRGADEVERTRNDLARIEQRVKDFEDASGVSIGNRGSFNDGKKIGEAVRFVLDGGEKQVSDKARYMLGNARALVTLLERMALPDTPPGAPTP